MTPNKSTKKPGAATGARHPRAFQGRGMLYILLALGLLLLVLMTVMFPMITARAPHTATIRIPAGATRQMVRDSVTRYLGNNYADKVMHLARLRKTDFSRRHGAYRIESGTNALEGMRILTSGAQTPVTVTVNGFRNKSLLIDRIASRLECSPEDLYLALCNPDSLRRYGLDEESAMALFLNDSYELYWSSSPSNVIGKIAANYRSLWNEERRAQADSLGLSPAQVMILASIVDEETNDLSEKGTIGRLYINRLRKGMRLQADPTIRFALNDFTIRRIGGDQLKVRSPYNTYLNMGLPPGPIRTTSRQTVTSILDARPNDYLYMCAREDFSGSHNFATDYATHTRNALRYQHALDMRGIRN